MLAPDVKSQLKLNSIKESSQWQQSFCSSTVCFCIVQLHVGLCWGHALYASSCQKPNACKQTHTMQGGGGKVVKSSEGGRRPTGVVQLSLSQANWLTLEVGAHQASSDGRMDACCSLAVAGRRALRSCDCACTMGLLADGPLAQATPRFSKASLTAAAPLRAAAMVGAFAATAVATQTGQTIQGGGGMEERRGEAGSD